MPIATNCYTLICLCRATKLWDPDVTHDYDIQPIAAEQTHKLRHTVLRQHQRLDDMVYDGDDLSDTVHLGAFAGDAHQPTLVGIVTIAPGPMPHQPQRGDWRLRGMAVNAGMQGHGVGRAIVQQAISEVAQRGGTRLWCNARVTAMGFYQRLGFGTHGDPFEIVPIGPHYVMSVAVT